MVGKTEAEEPVQGETNEKDHAEDAPVVSLGPTVIDDADHALFRRHLCPVCPANVAVSSILQSVGQNHGGAAVNYCCKAVQTVTKKKTVTVVKKVTRTTTLTASWTTTAISKVNRDMEVGPRSS